MSQVYALIGFLALVVAFFIAGMINSIAISSFGMGMILLGCFNVLSKIEKHLRDDDEDQK